MIDKFFYSMFGTIDGIFNWIDKKFNINQNERYKITGKIQSRNTTKKEIK